MSKEAWQAFEAKLSRGLDIETAAIESGVDLTEAEERAKRLLAKPSLAPIGLDTTGRDAIMDGLKLLRVIAGSAENDEIALEAAKALLRFGVDAAKIAVAGRGTVKAGSSPTTPDLFDITGERIETGNWSLKRPGA